MADDKQKYIDYARKKEVEYSIPTNLLVGLLQTESSYNPDIISGKRRSKAGAIGIAQFMPETAKEYGIDPLNPEQSIDAAAKYLHKSYKIFNNWEDAVLSYNAGAGKVKIYKKGKPITNKEHLEYTGKVFKNANINYENSVAPYINQNIDFSNSAEGITFEEEKPEKETEATQALKVLQEKQKEEDFLTELFSEQEQKIAELYKPIEEEQGSQPQSYDYNDISNFVESPILAQQGIKIDNMGYWNPKNWGHPVQINSNNITMEGVQQPLIGYAPETGEKRLMLPNTNHIFNGANRVIETPLTDKEKQFLKEITRIK